MHPCQDAYLASWLVSFARWPSAGDRVHGCTSSQSAPNLTQTRVEGGLFRQGRRRYRKFARPSEHLHGVARCSSHRNACEGRSSVCGVRVRSARGSDARAQLASSGARTISVVVAPLWLLLLDSSACCSGHQKCTERLMR